MKKEQKLSHYLQPKEDKMNLNIQDMQLFPTGLAIKWNDETDTLLPYEKLRTLCPCAYCSGETDVFGNVYKGPAQVLNEISYEITGLQPVGYYALRPFWKDGHNTGIFSYDLLFSLANQKSS